MKMHSIRNVCARRAAGWKKLGLGAGALLLLSASSCTVNTSSDVVVPLAGRLIVDWTIEGSTDPGLCAATNAPTFDIIISGAQAGEFQAPCAAFATSISTLVEGSYSANAVLLGPSGETRTTEIAVSPFVMTSADLSIPLDFPVNSFQ